MRISDRVMVFIQAKAATLDCDRRLRILMCRDVQLQVHGCMLDEPIEPPTAPTSVSSCIDVFPRPKQTAGGVKFNRLIDWLETPGQSSGSPEVATVLVGLQCARGSVR